MEVLLDGSDGQAVVTQELFAAAVAIIDAHRDIDEPLLQDILDAVEADLVAYAGLTRAEFIDAFSQ